MQTIKLDSRVNLAMCKCATILIILISLGACQVNSSTPSPTPELPLTIDLERVPGNWIAYEMEPLSGWDATIAYDVRIRTAPPDRSTIYLNYLQYPDEAAAISTYTRYSDHAFSFSDPTWFVPRDIDLEIITADIYQFQCKTFTIGVDQPLNTTMCTYVARYNNCIIRITTHIYDDVFTLEDFAELIHSYIEPEMGNLEHCNGH
jgi:hypothetical protein